MGLELILGLDVTLEIGEIVNVDGVVKLELEMPREVVAVRVTVKSVPLPDTELLVRFAKLPTAVDTVGNEELE